MKRPDEVETPGRSRYREPEPTLDFGFADDVPIAPDPLDPHPEHPTPIDLVLRLTRKQREKRVEKLVELAWRRYHEGIAKYAVGKNIAAVCLLRSGGNDSETISHIFRDVATHHVHANTGTGIEATRQFVRDTAKAAGKPLLEVHPEPGKGYREMVLGELYGTNRKTGLREQVWPGGFPGPAAHKIMYQRLKDRGLEQVPHLLGVSGSRTDRIVFVAGRRRPESKRRSTVPHYQRRYNILWNSPCAVWHKADLRAYRLMNPDMPTNEIARRIGMSGECGCLANATAGEADRWRREFPNDPFIKMIDELEALLADRDDIPEHRKKWGWAGEYDEPDEIERIDGLCSVNCGPDPIADAMDPLFGLEYVA